MVPRVVGLRRDDAEQMLLAQQLNAHITGSTRMAT
jgi:hypothetical protein